MQNRGGWEMGKGKGKGGGGHAHETKQKTQCTTISGLASGCRGNGGTADRAAPGHSGELICGVAGRQSLEVSGY